jgi:hypothetical protein
LKHFSQRSTSTGREVDIFDKGETCRHGSSGPAANLGHHAYPAAGVVEDGSSAPPWEVSSAPSWLSGEWWAACLLHLEGPQKERVVEEPSDHGLAPREGLGNGWAPGAGGGVGAERAIPTDHTTKSYGMNIFILLAKWKEQTVS